MWENVNRTTSQNQLEATLNFSQCYTENHSIWQKDMCADFVQILVPIKMVHTQWRPFSFIQILNMRDFIHLAAVVAS